MFTQTTNKQKVFFDGGIIFSVSSIISSL